MVVLFIQFLTRKLTALSLVKNYVVGIRTLHKLLGIDTLAFKDVMVHLMWMGLECNWVNPVHISAPITPQVLRDIHDNFYLAIDSHVVFWAACLVGFFILARKSNLVPVSKFEPGKQLATKHIKVLENKLEVELHWMKTRRPMQGLIVYPLHKIPGSNLCPHKALTAMFEHVS